MKKKLVITILGLICFCMSGCVATTNSDGDNVNSDKQSEMSSDVKTEEKDETDESETIIYDNEVNGEDEYYDYEAEYDEEIDEEYFGDVAE